MIHTDEFDYELSTSRRPKKKKLMVVLHGRGDSLKPFRDFDEELKIPGHELLAYQCASPLRHGFHLVTVSTKPGPGCFVGSAKTYANDGRA